MTFSGTGAGTEGDPYQITNWTELNEIRNNSDDYFILMNDLDKYTSDYYSILFSGKNNHGTWKSMAYNENSLVYHNDKYWSSNKYTTDEPSLESDDWDEETGWSSIGTFTGDLNGNKKTISNLYINRENFTETFAIVCFIHYVNGANIYDLGLKDIFYRPLKINSGYSSSFGGLAHAVSDSATISRCFVTGIIHQSRHSGGGFISSGTYPQIEDCYTDVNIYGTDASNSGFIRTAGDAAVGFCYPSESTVIREDGAKIELMNLYGDYKYKHKNGYDKIKNVEALFIGKKQVNEIETTNFKMDLTQSKFVLGENGKEIMAFDVIAGDLINTENGFEEVIYTNITEKEYLFFDIELENSDMLYINGILVGKKVI